MRKIKRYALQKKVLLIRLAAILLPMVLALSMLSQTAFAKNTYVITDGTRVFTYSSFATDPAAVLGEAGLQLGEDDTYTTVADDGVSAITVRRSQNITISCYGEVMEVVSLGEPLKELLQRLNIALGESDIVSVDLDTMTFDGMEVKIDRVQELDQTYTSTIPHETTYCYSDALPEGTREVLTAGEDGRILCSATVTYVNGLETKRTIHDQVVTVQPVTEVVSVGTGAAQEPVDPGAMPVIGDGIITLPTGEVLTYTDTMTVGATAYYCEPWERGITASGTRARVGEIAVDPRVIPLGTRLFIVSDDGEYVYGICVAEDTGYLIDGNRVDLYFNTRRECNLFGYRECTAYFLGTE